MHKQRDGEDALLQPNRTDSDLGLNLTRHYMTVWGGTGEAITWIFTGTITGRRAPNPGCDRGERSAPFDILRQDMGSQFINITLPALWTLFPPTSSTL